MLKHSRWFSNSGKWVFISLHQALKAAVATSSSNSHRLHSYQGGTERKGPEVFLIPRWFGPGRYFVHGAGLEATMECGWFGLATRLSSTRITYAIKFVGWNKIRYEVSCRKSGWFFSGGGTTRGPEFWEEYPNILCFLLNILPSHWRFWNCRPYHKGRLRKKNPCLWKKLWFILHFRTLGTFLVFFEFL